MQHRQFMKQQLKRTIINKINRLKIDIRKNRKSVIFLCCFVLFAASYTIFSKYDLLYNGKLITGTVVEISSHSKSLMRDLVFVYLDKDEQKKSSTSYDLKQPNQFIGKSFPVIISTLTGQTELLVTPNQFKKYRLPFPDSLKWVLQYVKPF